MKNSQVAAICVCLLLAAALIAYSNFSVACAFKTCEVKPQIPSEVEPHSKKTITIGMMPKIKGHPYFISCLDGAREAEKELGVKLLWDGPVESDPSQQVAVVESWITKRVDVIAVSVESPASISDVLRKARAKGIKVITWDADADKNARNYLINQATPQGIGETLADRASEILKGKGEVAIITSALTSANQNAWIDFIKKRFSAKHPGIRLIDDIRPCDEDQGKAFSEAQNIMKVHPETKVIIGVCSPAVPGASEAVKQSGRNDVKVIGLSTPNSCKPFVHGGSCDSIVLWNTKDLGYLTVFVAQALADGTLKNGDTSFKAGKLGQLQIVGETKDEVLLGKPFLFTKDNIDEFDF